jgi:hypothetical protein
LLGWLHGFDIRVWSCLSQLDYVLPFDEGLRELDHASAGCSRRSGTAQQ